MDKSFSVKSCLSCGKSLTGRIDKKFCDAQCKAVFHNRNKSLGEEMISHFNSTLRHNRRILRTLCPEGKSTVRQDILIQMGYKFKFHTNIYQSSKGGRYYMVYDYGFTAIREGAKKKAVIVKRQEYMDKIDFDPWQFPG